MEQLVEKEKTEQLDEHLKELCTAIRQHPDLLPLCQALVRKKRLQLADDTLPRGTTNLLSLSDYMVRATLQHLTGVDGAIFENMD
eukprot:9122496-Lingulodinium_polyedra.AAC.1